MGRIQEQLDSYYWRCGTMGRNPKYLWSYLETCP